MKKSTSILKKGYLSCFKTTTCYPLETIYYLYAINHSFETLIKRVYHDEQIVLLYDSKSSFAFKEKIEEALLQGKKPNQIFSFISSFIDVEDENHCRCLVLSENSMDQDFCEIRATESRNRS